MATKKATKTVSDEVKAKSDAIISKYGESPIHGADTNEVNQALSKLTLVKPEKSNEVIDGYESELHFLNGKVPAGFTKTYGQEITDASEGQTAELITSVYKVFKKEDGFRFFLKFLDNFIFTIVVPIRLSNQDDLSYAYYKADIRSCVLQPGKVTEQVEMFAKKVARHLGYQKNR